MEGLSVALAVAQFIDSTSKLVSAARKIHSGEPSPGGERSSHLKTIIEDLTTLNDGLRQGQLASLSGDAALLDLAEKCNKLGSRLVDTLNSLQKQKGSAHGRVRLALKEKWHENDIKAMSEDLLNYRQQLVLHVLASQAELLTTMNHETKEEISKASKDQLQAFHEIQERSDRFNSKSDSMSSMQQCYDSGVMIETPYAEDDRQSVRSANSSMTAFTTLSGKTAIELEGATVELQNIFQERATLVPLYRRAIKDEFIGPERLRRNVGRLLKIFAQDLRREAGQELERMACRFVSTKASYIAHCIVEDLNDTPLSQLPLQYNIEHEHVDEIEDRGRHEADDTDDLLPVDEDVFEDLPRLRAFLVNSAAFQAYREELARFALPKELQSSLSGDREQDREIRLTPTSRWFRLDAIELALNSVLIATGFLEPPLRPDMTRLRWQFHCGETFFEDVIEYEAGGISELVQEMLPYCVKITATAYSEGSPNQAYSLAPFNSLQAVWRKITAAFRGFSDSHGDPSQDSSPQVSGEDIEADSAIPLTESLLLLAGLHTSQQQIYLSQDSVKNVKTDFQLFQFMKNQLDSRHSFRQRLFSTTRVRNIHFNKFYLRALNNLEVRTHDPCCTGQLLQDCECIPPRSRVEGGPNAEYRCKPAGPLKRWPPVLSQYLVHRVQDPSSVGKKDVTVLQKIPRRICGKLQAEDDQEAEGWGIYYEEGPNLLWVAVLTTLIASLTALFFGILWATLKNDLQGAFGVSGYVGTVCGAIVPLLAWYQNS